MRPERKEKLFDSIWRHTLRMIRIESAYFLTTNISVPVRTGRFMVPAPDPGVKIPIVHGVIISMDHKRRRPLASKIVMVPKANHKLSESDTESDDQSTMRRMLESMGGSEIVNDLRNSFGNEGTSEILRLMSNFTTTVITTDTEFVTPYRDLEYEFKEYCRRQADKMEQHLYIWAEQTLKRIEEKGGG